MTPTEKRLAWRLLVAGLLSGWSVGASFVAVSLVAFDYDVRDLAHPTSATVQRAEDSLGVPVKHPGWPAEVTVTPPRYRYTVGGGASV